MDSLHQLITFLEYGTHLHIGVLFFGSFGNHKLTLPTASRIHANPICDYFKNQDNGFARCYRCRNAAIRKALKGEPFGGCCINGVYEYTHPIVTEGKVRGMIFIGNILPPKPPKAPVPLLQTLEADFGEERCAAVAELVEHYILTALSEESVENFDPLIQNLKSYIDANLEYTLDLSAIAGMFHYNEKYLGRLFKKKTGMSISEYICRVRVGRGKELLRSSNDTVMGIAEKTGFNNVTYFNRVFKKYVGQTPLEYRKNPKR